MIVLNSKRLFGFVLVQLSVIFTECSNKNTRTPRIAIIGGGIGGTVTAYELSKLAAKHGYDISLDLYEAEEIGGRLATIEVNGYVFETGASIIHIENKHMENYVLSNGLSWYEEPEGYCNDEITGLYDGEEFIYLSSNFRFYNIIRMLWRYGYGLRTFYPSLVQPMLEHFKRIYKAQEEEKQFDDVYSMLAFMNEAFPDLMRTQLFDYMRSHGYGEKLIKEIMFVATNVNYNQNVDIPAFAGSVSLAGGHEGLRAVEGGNKRVPEILLERSDAKLIRARVESVTLLPNSTFALAVDDASQIYDYVVVACPIMENYEKNLKFNGFPDLKIPQIKYKKTVATIVHGELNHTFFHYDSPKGLPNQIMSINNTLFYNSISALMPVVFDWEYDKKVFKVFSKDILTDEQLDLLFLTRYDVTVIPWLAYPSYDTDDRNLKFELRENLFYVNAIEWAASAMEMSAVSGVNIALHINKRVGD